jgi:hypothetical protein
LAGVAVVVCLLTLALLPGLPGLPGLPRPRSGVVQAGPDPAMLVDGFEQARNRRDVDATLAYFADDATLTDRTSRIYQGRDEIRGYLQQLALRGRGLNLASANVRVNGTHVTWTERPPNQTPGGFEVSVDAVIRDGKIHSLVYSGSATIQRGDAALDGRGSVPSLMGLMAVLLTLSGGAALISAASNRPISGRESQLRGRLVAELATWRADQRH